MSSIRHHHSGTGLSSVGTSNPRSDWTTVGPRRELFGRRVRVRENRLGAAGRSPIRRRCGLASGVFAAAAMVAVFATSPAAAVDGQLDPSFGFDGRTSIAFDQPGSDRADLGCSAVRQSDDRIVIGGLVSTVDGLRLGFTRLLPNGDPDVSFGSDGKVVLSIVPYPLGLCPNLAVQADGKILATGTYLAGTFTVRSYVVRLTADGALDPTFSGDGILLPATLQTGDAILAHADGTIWAAGSDQGVLTILRLTSTGTLLAQLDIDFYTQSGTLGRASALALQPNGKVLVCGTETYSGNDTDFIVARLTSSLVLDPSFSGSGARAVAFDVAPNKSDVCSAVAVDPSGRVVVSGTASNATNSASSFAVARLLTNGDLDSSFGTSGMAIVPSLLPPYTQNDDTHPALLVQSDAKVLLASAIPTGDASNTSDAVVYRLTSSGAIDTPYGDGFGGIVFDMAPDGPGVEADAATAMVNQGGQPVIVGTGEYNAPDTDVAAARLTSSLIFANGFDDGSSWWWGASP